MTKLFSVAPGGGRDAALKLIGIGALTLMMIIPLMLIASLVDERRDFAREAAESVAQGWGGPQVVSGPYLIVPFAVPEQRDANGAVLTMASAGEMIVLPKALDATAVPGVEERARGIFRVPVYAADITLAGSFVRPDFPQLPRSAVIDWEAARLALSIRDVRGLSGDVALDWNGAGGATFASGTGINAMPLGIQTTAVPATGETPFKVSLRLRGTGRLAFVPVGETFTARIASPWQHPSFDGAYLPESRDIGETGFNAVWKVSHLARSLPQTWVNGQSINDTASEFGVTFFQPVDFYQLVDRSLKYAILFVGLSFLVFFLVETVSGGRIHVVQYLLAGAAQVIFYLLLLALAEQVGFAAAYLAAGLACTALTTLYTASVLQSSRSALAVGIALTVLYGLLYTLLNEEDYALLTGAIASFLALALTMFLTRRVDWYEAKATLAAPAAHSASGEA